MWKYVSRRLKETIDRANNILDVHRTWNYTPTTVNTTDTKTGAGPSAIDKHIKSSSLRPRNFDRGLCTSGTPKSNEKSENAEGHKKKYCNDDDFKIHDNLLSAITWSGAIVCGWYASQLLCLHRRRLGWDNNRCNRYMKILSVPSRALHLNAYSHIVFTAPKNPSPSLFGKVSQENFPYQEKYSGEKTFESTVYEVANETEISSGNEQQPKAKQTVAESVADLVQFLGDTEFQLATQNLAAGHYRSAVKHLKAASSHRHPGATFNLGLCYERGLGVTKNLENAMECYQLASSMGHSKAIYNLGVYYARGLGGLEKDKNAAKKCFITAAKLGQTEAKIALGLKPDDIIDGDFVNFNATVEYNATSKVEKHASYGA
uniref:Putative extracellular protein sel-1 n=1 Tax=Tabanus bromius TaxID=304241 RepID=A0A0K8TS30_TABBR